MLKISILVLSCLYLYACQTNTAQNKSQHNTTNLLNENEIDSATAPKDSQNISKNETKKMIEIDSTLTAEYLMGQFEPSKDERFVKISPPYSNGDMYGRKEMFAAFKEMQSAAKKDEIKLTIVSATRTYEMQKSIWEGKWNSKRPVDGKILPPLAQLSGKERALKILLWNSMPSTSRHHWGTDIDMNSTSPAYFAAGQGKKEYDWLANNAGKFGFCQTYSEFGESRTTGYQVEKWHWSYLPIAQKCTEAYPILVKNEDIKGFVGAETAVDIDIISNYVLGINKGCQAKN